MIGTLRSLHDRFVILVLLADEVAGAHESARRSRVDVNGQARGRRVIREREDPPLLFLSGLGLLLMGGTDLRLKLGRVRGVLIGHLRTVVIERC